MNCFWTGKEYGETCNWLCLLWGCWGFASVVVLGDAGPLVPASRGPMSLHLSCALQAAGRTVTASKPMFSWNIVLKASMPGRTPISISWVGIFSWTLDDLLVGAPASQCRQSLMYTITHLCSYCCHCHSSHSECMCYVPGTVTVHTIWFSHKMALR